MSPFSQGRNVSWNDMPQGMGFYAEGKDVPVDQMPEGMGFGTSNLQSVLNKLASGDFSNIFRLAGTVGNLVGPGFDTAASTKELQKMADETTQKINERISNIYPGLTGRTAAQMIPEYERRFAETAERVRQQGRADLGIDPEISKQYNQLNTRVQDIQNQYSLGGRLGGYEKLALDPAVVSMDVSSIRKAADWSAPEIASQYGMLTDYSGPQASKFIYGNRGTADAIGRYYNTSGDVAGLMSYGTLA